MTIVEVLQARRRIAPYIRRTPLLKSHWLSTLAGADVALKLESLQVSNSFKARGAFNAVIARRERAARTSTPFSTLLVTASAGNHGRALAAAAEAFGLRLVVFTPADAPETKLSAIRRHGADLRAEGRDYEDAERRAKAFARNEGADYLSAYSDPDIIAGAATVALELFEDAPDTNVVVAPVGGGGLIAGLAETVRQIAPDARVIGVEVEASCPFHTSLLAGRLVEVPVSPTLADGLAGNPDSNTVTFAPIQRFVDRIVTVGEEHLAAAIVGLARQEHLVVEGAGAAGVAALIGARLAGIGGRVATVITGGNIDGDRLQTLLASVPAA